MLLNKKYTEKELLVMMKEYFQTYSDIDDYSFKATIEEMYDEGLRSEAVPYLVNQFYHEYKLMDDDKDLYVGFNEMLKKIYPNKDNMSITEVGGGTVPQLARLIAKTSKKETVVYDTRISKINNPYDNLSIRHREFTSNTDITDSDLLIGLLPCDATEYIIENACANRKNFLIALCGCSHFPSHFYYDTFIDESLIYRNYVIELAKEKAKENDMGELHTSNALLKYNFPYPVIYTDKE